MTARSFFVSSSAEDAPPPHHPSEADVVQAAASHPRGPLHTRSIRPSPLQLAVASGGNSTPWKSARLTSKSGKQPTIALRTARSVWAPTSRTALSAQSGSDTSYALASLRRSPNASSPEERHIRVRTRVVDRGGGRGGKAYPIELSRDSSVFTSDGLYPSPCFAFRIDLRFAVLLLLKHNCCCWLCFLSSIPPQWYFMAVLVATLGLAATFAAVLHDIFSLSNAYADISQGLFEASDANLVVREMTLTTGLSVAGYGVSVSFPPSLPPSLTCAHRIVTNVAASLLCSIVA